MDKLPVELFDLILVHLTLTDWKCLRLTCHAIYTRLSSISSYSRIHPIVLSPKSSSGISLLEKIDPIEGIDHLSLINFNYTELQSLLQTSDSLRLCLQQLKSLSLARSTTLIDPRLFIDLLTHCSSLEKLDLSDCKYLFLAHKFLSNQSAGTQSFNTVKRLNLNGNTLISDYAFNQLILLFPNIEALHLLGVPLRSHSNFAENRTFLTFENLSAYFQKHQQRFQALTISFDPSLSCDTQIKRLFPTTTSPILTYLHIDGLLSTSALTHLLLFLDNQVETLIIGRLALDINGCRPLFAALSEYAPNLKQLCVFLNTPNKFPLIQQQQIHFPVTNPISDISLLPLIHLSDLDIQSLYPLTEIDLLNLFGNRDALPELLKLALPRNTTDRVIKSICSQSSFANHLTHINLSNCSSLSNRSLLAINKSMFALEELTVNFNTQINDLAFIGMSICGIGKSIEWLDETMIDRKFIDEIPVWTCSITHQPSCKCRPSTVLSSSCVKLRLKDFNLDLDDSSDRILAKLTDHPMFNQYFHPINKLKRLKRLKLRQCVLLTSRLFRFGLRDLPNLQILDMSHCERMTDKYLSLLGTACPSLESVDMTGCHRITEHGRQALRTTAKRLRIIDF